MGHAHSNSRNGDIGIDRQRIIQSRAEEQYCSWDNSATHCLHRADAVPAVLRGVLPH